MKRIFFISTFMCMCTFALHAEYKNLSPFGIELGNTIKPTIKLTDLRNSDIKFINNPPKPVSLFSTYAVQLNKNKDVIKVIGLTKTFEDDDYCYKSQEVYLKIENLLTKKYGKPTSKSNYLSSDSIWTNSREYKMSLVQNERFHYSKWDAVKNFSNIQIYMEEGADRKGCYVKLIYSDNTLSKEQNEEKEKADIDSL